MSSETQLSPNISVLTQYVKDLSFENICMPLVGVSVLPKPEITIELSVVPNKLPDPGIYEVVMNISATTFSSETKLFVIELSYAGVFVLKNIPQEDHMAVLAIDCASLIFPFARKIIASTTQDGGFQPLMIDSINFAQLYHSKLSQKNSLNTSQDNSNMSHGSLSSEQSILDTELSLEDIEDALDESQENETFPTPSGHTSETIN